MSSSANRNDKLDGIVAAFEQAFSEFHEMVTHCKDSSLDDEARVLTSSYDSLVTKISIPWDPPPSPNSMSSTAVWQEEVDVISVPSRKFASDDDVNTVLLNSSGDQQARRRLHIDLGEIQTADFDLAQDILRTPPDDKLTFLVNSVTEQKIDRIIIQNDSIPTENDQEKDLSGEYNIDKKVASLRKKLKGNFLILVFSILFLLASIGLIAYSDSASTITLRLLSLVAIMSVVTLSISFTSIVFLSWVRGKMLSEQMNEIKEAKTSVRLANDARTVVLLPRELVHA